MVYEKPVAVSLSDQARYAKGGSIEGCVSGVNTGLTSATCGTGGTAYGSCAPGGTAGILASCAGGAAAPDGDCLSGTIVNTGYGYCEAGPSGSNDPYGCTAGPSFS
jgi:hypothetical protein